MVTQNKSGYQHIIVLSTCPGSITAKKIAQDLVENKLAACVNAIPGVQSYFSWVGKVDSAEEHLLIIKTTHEHYAALEKRIQTLHPYELPEIIAVPISTGSSDYLKWIQDSTKS